MPAFPPLISMEAESARQEPSRGSSDSRNWLVESILGASQGQGEATNAVDRTLSAIRGDLLFSPQSDNWLGAWVQAQRPGASGTADPASTDSGTEGVDDQDPISRLLAGDLSLDQEGQIPGQESASPIVGDGSAPALDPTLGVRLGQTLEVLAEQSADWGDAGISSSNLIAGPLPVSSFSFRGESARPASPAGTNAPGADPWSNLVTASFDSARAALTPETSTWQSGGFPASAGAEESLGGAGSGGRDSGLFHGVGEGNPGAFVARDLQTGARAGWGDAGEAGGSAVRDEGRWDIASGLGSPRDAGTDAWGNRGGSGAGTRAIDAWGDAFSSPLSSSFDRPGGGSAWDRSALPSAWDSRSRFDPGSPAMPPVAGSASSSGPAAFPGGAAMPGPRLGGPFGGRGPAANPLAPVFPSAGSNPGSGIWSAFGDPARGR